LQELEALLHALWPLQALAAMHLPCAALAGVDTVDTTVPARNSVAAAAASVAPDLESNFMTFSSMIDDNDAVRLRCSIRQPHNERTNVRSQRLR
jgi:hypothetical protein